MTDFARILDDTIDSLVRSRAASVDVARGVISALESLADDNDTVQRVYRVERRDHPFADWELRGTVAHRRMAERLATVGEAGQTRLLSYLVEDIGPTITLPVDVPAEAPAARVTG